MLDKNFCSYFLDLADLEFLLYEQAGTECKNFRKAATRPIPLSKNHNNQYAIYETQIKIDNQGIKDERTNKTNLSQLKTNLLEKPKRLSKINTEKGISNWLTALP